jgi:hypothetical protein
MEPVRFEDVERSDEVDEVVEAIRDGRRDGWVKPYSANGKHGGVVRRDPGTVAD